MDKILQGTLALRQAVFNRLRPGQKKQGDTNKREEFVNQVTLKHLEHLEERMKNVSKESNGFASKYLFGGMVAVIALLNTDLLIDEAVPHLRANPPVLALLLLTVLILSWIYFNAVSQRILRFNRAYRKTKHKYEILFYGLLLQAQAQDILVHLEKDPKPTDSKLPFPGLVAFQPVADYLHDHHGRALADMRADKNELDLAIIIVVIAILVKLLIYAALVLPAD
jgi:hypothetical protein